MGIIYDFIFDILKNKLSEKLTGVIDSKRLSDIINKLENESAINTIYNYRDEIYYNDLDAYISDNNLVAFLIKICYDKHDKDYEINKLFATKHTNSFLSRFEKHNIHSHTIHYIFNHLYEIIDNTLNEYGMDNQTRILANKITQNSEELLNAVTNKSDLMEEKLNLLVAALNTPVIDSGLNESIYKEYKDKIANIINSNDNNDPLKYKTIIHELDELIQDIIDITQKITEHNLHVLLCHLYDTQALYYTNLGDLNKAHQLIAKIDNTYIKNINDIDTAKRHYYIKSYILVQHFDFEKNREALTNINKAIEIDPNYHVAIMLKYEIESYLFSETIGKEIGNLNKYYDEYIAHIDDSKIIAYYYQTLGILYMQNTEYANAVNMFHKANEIDENISNKINIAITHYKWALEKYPEEKIISRPEIDYIKLIESLNLLSELLCNNDVNHNISNFLIPYYISASNICGQYDNLVNSTIENIDYSKLDYSTIHTILLEKAFSNKLTEGDMNLLTIEDQILLKVDKIISGGKPNYIVDAISYIEDNLHIVDTENKKKLYHPLLELHLRNKDIQKYNNCINDMKQIEIINIYHDLHNIIISEISGDIDTAIKLSYECLDTTLDTYIVFTILDFYIRNKLNNELLYFYNKIHEKIINRTLTFHNLDGFYCTAIKFLIEENYDFAKKILNEIDKETISKEAYYKISILIYGKVNDHISLIDCYTQLIKIDNNIQYKFDLSKNYKSIGKYDDAEVIVLDLLDDVELSNDYKTESYMLLSELCLYKKDFDRSYEYAKKSAELNELIPSHNSHKFFSAVSIRCNKQEGLDYAIEYKHQHPNVVNWIEEVKLPQNEDGSLNPNDIKEVFNKFSGNNNHFKQILELYKNRIFSIYHLAELNKSTYNNVLLWDVFYKLKFDIFNGDINRLNEEKIYEVKKIVVDALAVLILAKNDMLFLLNDFEQIYITSSNVLQLQKEYTEALIYTDVYISNALKFIDQPNIIICENAPQIPTAAQKVHIPDFLYDALFYSVNNDIYFLYSDSIILNMIPLFIDRVIPAIGITALIAKYAETDIVRSLECRFELLKNNYHFINFDHNDMYYQFQINEFDFSKTNVAPFFQCKSHYNMRSFGIVYTLLLKRLIYENHKICAVSYVNYLLEFLDKTYKRSRHYFDYISVSEISNEKLYIMQDFIKYTLSLIFKILNSNDDYSKIIEQYVFNNIEKELINSIKALNI